METFTYEERQEAFAWASGLSLKSLQWMVMILASEIDALASVNRKAVMEVVAMRLGRELDEGKDWECRCNIAGCKRSWCK